RQPSLEAQIANLADEIAYNNHDVDDGLRAGLLTLEQLESVALVRRMLDEVRGRYPDIPERRLIHEVVRRMINRLVTDVIESSVAAIAAAAPRDIEAVRGLTRPLIAMSEAASAEHLELKSFLRDNLYRHYRVARMTRKARRVVSELFDAFMDDVQLMPPEHQEAARAAEMGQGANGRARAVADYIAGMTDRYAIGEHQRMFTPGERS
ncbi:deoxyguanosinetriphosphate triphosphohydrolase, partial [bacterium]